jgi:hypothetical protein
MKTCLRILACLCITVLSYGVAQADIAAYDANGQFIGYSVGDLFFNPYLNKYLQISPLTGDLIVSGVMYENLDCVGTPYIYGAHYLRVFKSYDGKYYISKNVAPSIKDLYSEAIPGGCSNHIDLITGLPYSVSYPVVPMVEITNMPLNLPVAIPIKLILEKVNNNKK